MSPSEYAAKKYDFAGKEAAKKAEITDPLYSEIDATNLESVRKNVVFDNLFVDTPFQAKLRRPACSIPFLGGSGMFEGFIYGRPQGAAVAPGSTVTVTRQQMNTGMKFLPKAYVAWAPLG
jgi:hypothetical protein